MVNVNAKNVSVDNNYYQTLQSYGLSENQLSRLGRINGTADGNQIDKCVFDIAKSIADGTQLTGPISQNAALVQEVRDVMRGIDMTKITEDFETSVMTGVDPTNFMNGLGLTKEQTDRILELSETMTKNKNTIDRGIAAAVIAMVRGQVAPNGISESMNEQIRCILNGQQINNNSTFGY